MIALVTGGTAGIGRSIAEKLASAGANVIVTGRDRKRGEDASDALSGRFIEVDHSLLSANLRLAETLRETTEAIDILVNNVGAAAFETPSNTEEGHEAIEAINYLGPVTLTNALLSHLSANATIVNILSSAFEMHHGDPFTPVDPYVAIKAYARAKQLNLLATMSLARQVPITVNSVNPGMAWTPGTQALTPAAVPAWRFIWPAVRYIQRRASPEKAAGVPTELALRPDSTGGYYAPKRTDLPKRLQSEELQDRAWTYPLSLAD